MPEGRDDRTGPGRCDSVRHGPRRKQQPNGEEPRAALRSERAVGCYVLLEITPNVLAAAARLRNQYRSLRLNLSDAVAMALAVAYDTECVLTVDNREFRSVPLTSHTALRLLPAKPV
ncbi:PIN domain-containing protein [Streptomyces sp. NBC_01707]|uniref:PIN domain-containing protein n=1 Tax=Streptomyces sp. NBC_01707 TaxID=2975914 RepID=UPI00352D0337